MPTLKLDEARCYNATCPSYWLCLRATDKPDFEWLPASDFQPDGDKCGDFIENETILENETLPHPQ